MTSKEASHLPAKHVHLKMLKKKMFKKIQTHFTRIQIPEDLIMSADRALVCNLSTSKKALNRQKVRVDCDENNL